MTDSWGESDKIVASDNFGAKDEVVQDGALTRGFKKMKQNVALSADIASGDSTAAAQNIKDSQTYASANPGMKESKPLMDAWNRGDGVLGGIGEVGSQVAKDYRKAEGFISGAKAVGRDLRAMGEGVVEQVPNMIAPMAGQLAGGYAGAQLGSVAGGSVGAAFGGVGAIPGAAIGGTVGGIAGAFTGSAAGNAALEVGQAATDAMSKAGVDLNDSKAVKAYIDQHRGDIIKQGVAKGAIIGAVDTATLGAGHALLTAPAKAATDRALTAMGVDVADKVAVKEVSNTPAFKALISNDAVYQASQKGAGNIARNVGAATLEPAGEFAGEYLGEGIAKDNWDTKNAALEALSSIGQSGATFAGQKAYQYTTKPRSGEELAPTNEQPVSQEQPQSPIVYPDEVQPTLALPAPSYNVAPDGVVMTTADQNDAIQAQRQVEADRQDRINRGEILDVTPIPSSGIEPVDAQPTPAAPTPSELMGLDPNAGPMSSAAALAVDSGAHAQLSLQSAAEQATKNQQDEKVNSTTNATQGGGTGSAAAQSSSSSPLALASDILTAPTNAKLNLPEFQALNRLKIPDMNDEQLQKLSSHYNEVAPTSKRAVSLDQAVQSRGLAQDNSTAQNNTHELTTPQADPATRWSSMTPAERKVVTANTDLKPVIANNLSKVNWETLNPEVQQKLSASMQSQDVSAKPRDMPATLDGLKREYVDAHNAGDKVRKQQLISHGDSLFGQQASMNAVNDAMAKNAKTTPTPASLDTAAHEAATSPQNDKPVPTDAQKEAGNYAKGHVRVSGLDISIENPQGSERTGKREDGSTWSHKMSNHYGYIKRTEGADGDHVDVYVGNKPDSTHAYVVDQLDQKTGGFDEHKIMLGFADQDSAVQAYKSNFDKGWNVGPVTAMTTDDFKTWLKDGDTKSPVAKNEVQPDVEPKAAVNTQPKAKAAPKNQSKSVVVKVKEKARSDYFKAGNIVKSYGGKHDRVISYNTPDENGDWSVNVQSVDKQGNEWVANGDVRTHQTEPDVREMKAGVVDHSPDKSNPTIKNSLTVAPMVSEPRVNENVPVGAQSNDVSSESGGEVVQKQGVVNTPTEIKSDSELGAAHTIPINLIDRTHKLADVVGDFSSVRSSNDSEGQQEHTQKLVNDIIAKNPDVQVRVVHDLNQVDDPAIRSGLKASGGHYDPDTNTAYIHLQTKHWEGSASNLMNHELVHAVTAHALREGKVPKETLDSLDGIRDTIKQHLFDNHEGLSDHVQDRLMRATENNDELLSVGIGEHDVNSAIKGILSKDDFDKLNSSFEQVSKNPIKGSANEKQRGSSTVTQEKSVSGVQHDASRRSETTTRPTTADQRSNETSGLDTTRSDSLEGQQSEQTTESEVSAKTKNLLQRYDEIAKAYGRSVNSDGAILSSTGKDTGARIAEKQGRMQVKGKDGSLLFSGSKPESLGDFLERYWGDQKDETRNADNKPSLTLTGHQDKKQNNDIKFSKGISSKDNSQQKEIELVRAKHFGTPTWMKAPNGSSTNLSERQWLQVRTPSFKNWFGDWEAASHQAVLNGAPVAVVSKDNVPTGGMVQVRMWAAKLFNAQGSKADNPILGEVALSGQSVRDSIAHGMSRHKGAAFEAVKDVIEKGVLLNDATRDVADRSDYYIAAPVKIDGTDEIVTVHIKRALDSQRMYLHSVTMKERLLMPQAEKQVFVADTESTNKVISPKTTSADVHNILHHMLTLNPDSVSKVVDENGEPMVMYHGTSGDFNVFEEGQVGKHFGDDAGIFFTNNIMHNTGSAINSTTGLRDVYGDSTSAVAYAKNAALKGGSASIIPVFLNVRNPKVEIQNAEGDVLSLIESRGVAAGRYVAQAVTDGFDGVIAKDLDTTVTKDGSVFGKDAGNETVVAVLKSNQIKSAIGNSGSFDASNPDISYSFAGQKAQGADLHSLANAKQLIGEGNNAEAVRQETGWHRGADAKWRFEVSDDQAELKPAGNNAAAVIDRAHVEAVADGRKRQNIGDILDHPQLFAAYPALKDIPVSLMPADVKAEARIQQFATGLEVQLAGNLPRSEIASAILHELQHAIQNREGFAMGGSRKTFISDYDKTGAQTYKRLAGEVEARNTQMRKTMTPRLRREIAPEETADTPESKVLVSFNGKDITPAILPNNTFRPAMTSDGLRSAFQIKYPQLMPALKKMLARGETGQRGGVVILDSADPLRIAHAFAKKTGTPFSEAVQMFSEDGSINGFFDPKSGLTFLVGPNLDSWTGPAVLLHEMVHGQQRASLDKQALEMLMNRGQVKNKDLSEFLDRVAARMIDAGEAANAQEATAYIVEQAVMEGQKQGFGEADSRFLSWVDSSLGKRVGDFIRSFLRMTRQWMLRNGMPISNISVSDMVNYAQAGLIRAAEGKVKGAQKEASFSLNESTDAPFQKAIDDVVVGKTPNRFINLGTTPDVLKMIGLPEAKVSIHGKTIEKVMGQHLGIAKGEHSNLHNLSPETLKQLPKQLNNPIAIFQSGQDAVKQGYVVLTELRETNVSTGNDHPVIAALHLRKTRDGVELMNVASVYGKESRQALQHSLDNDLLYWNKEKGLQFINAEQLQLPLEARLDADLSKANIKSNDDLVNYQATNRTDIRFSRSGVRDIASKATAELNSRFNAPGKLSAWHKTVGTMYNLAERSPAFKPVFEAAQNFIDDVSFYASEAAELAPKILPKLDAIKDITKKPISADDNKAIAKPIFEGTLLWGRDRDGTPVLVDSLAEAASKLSTERKAQILETTGNLPAGIHKAWKALPAATYAKMIDSRYETTFLKAGVVWTDDELKSLFSLNDEQIALYHEFRDSANQSLDSMTKAEMLRIGGKDVKDMQDQVMSAQSATEASHMLMERLSDIAMTEPDRATSLFQAVQDIKNRVETTVGLQAAGYAPLSRFGKYTVDVVEGGERQYFGLFETMHEANTMAAQMRSEFGITNVSQGTLSAESYKLFAGITPESLELFGNMLGLESDGDKARDQAFQEYIRLTKNNRSAMKRLIHRKGIAGYSEDVGRVLASFVYSNARQTAGGLHMGDLDEAVQAIPKAQGELTDVAVKLRDYIKNPQEEGQAIRGLLFAQFLGGSIASAMVNMTQPITVTFPYLSQFGGAKNAAAQLAKAAKQMAGKGAVYEPDLAVAMKRAEDDGTISPQEVHQLMKQARGANPLTSGDGTYLGDGKALAQNTMTRFSLAWGKLFSAAEQINRQVTFIAAYRIAKEQGIADPDSFARKAINETQFVYTKASKMQWGRGAIGGTLMTFKTYSIAYLELMHRLWNQGEAGSVERKQGRKAAMLMIATMLVLSGAGGLPFEDDLIDLIDGLAGYAGYNFSTKKARQEFLEETLGKPMADFVDKGVTGLPGVPLDVSGRLGMGNLIPGTGIFKQSNNHTNDVMELLGPAGKLATNVFSGLDDIAKGDVLAGLKQMAPNAVQNAVQGGSMATSGMYKDTKGYKVVETNGLEAALKAIGFQPSSVADIQEANWHNQSAKAFYSLKKQEINAQWANGIFMKDPNEVQAARDAITSWNEKNPDQRMVISMASVLKKAKEMNKSKDQRIADTAPKAMRTQMRQDVAQRKAETLN